MLLPEPFEERTTMEIERIQRRKERVFRVFIGACLLICALILLAIFWWRKL
jgi:hypothetical protein